jgi:hypothetical protein
MDVEGYSSDSDFIETAQGMVSMDYRHRSQLQPGTMGLGSGRGGSLPPLAPPPMPPAMWAGGGGRPPGLPGMNPRLRRDGALLPAPGPLPRPMQQRFSGPGDVGGNVPPPLRNAPPFASTHRDPSMGGGMRSFPRPLLPAPGNKARGSDDKADNKTDSTTQQQRSATSLSVVGTGRPTSDLSGKPRRSDSGRDSRDTGRDEKSARGWRSRSGSRHTNDRNRRSSSPGRRGHRNEDESLSRNRSSRGSTRQGESSRSKSREERRKETSSSQQTQKTSTTDDAAKATVLDDIPLPPPASSSKDSADLKKTASDKAESSTKKDDKEKVDETVTSAESEKSNTVSSKAEQLDAFLSAMKQEVEKNDVTSSSHSSKAETASTSKSDTDASKDKLDAKKDEKLAEKKAENATDSIPDSTDKPESSEKQEKASETSNTQSRSRRSRSRSRSRGRRSSRRRSRSRNRHGKSRSRSRHKSRSRSRLTNRRVRMRRRSNERRIRLRRNQRDRQRVLRGRDRTEERRKSPPVIRTRPGLLETPDSEQDPPLLMPPLSPGRQPLAGDHEPRSWGAGDDGAAEWAARNRDWDSSSRDRVGDDFAEDWAARSEDRGYSAPLPSLLSAAAQQRVSIDYNHQSTGGEMAGNDDMMDDSSSWRSMLQSKKPSLLGEYDKVIHANSIVL